MYSVLVHYEVVNIQFLYDIFTLCKYLNRFKLIKLLCRGVSQKLQSSFDKIARNCS